MAWYRRALYFKDSSVIKTLRGVRTVFPAMSWQTGFLLLPFNSLPQNASFKKVLRWSLHAEPFSLYFRETTREEGSDRGYQKRFSKACWNYFSIPPPFQFPTTFCQLSRIACFAWNHLCISISSLSLPFCALSVKIKCWLRNSQKFETVLSPAQFKTLSV